MAMLRRIELTDGSMRTRSDSLRDTTRGRRRTSGDVLGQVSTARSSLLICIGLVYISSTHADSISGLLWRSTCCDAKFSKVRAAVRVARTALRYGRRVLDCGQLVSTREIAG